MQTTFTCPYCQHKNIRNISANDGHLGAAKDHITSCNEEDGGCGRKLIWSLKLKPEITISEVSQPKSV